MAFETNRINILISATDAASGAIDKVGSRAGKLGSKLKGVGKAGAAMGIALGVAGLAGGIKMAIGFDKGMQQVKTLLPNITEEAFGKMNKDIIQFSKTMGVDATDATRGLYDAISAQVPVENVMSFLQQAAEASIAGGADLQTTVKALAQVQNVYGTETATTKENSDILFATIKAGMTTLPELATKMGFVLPTAQSMNVSFKDVAANLAVITGQSGNTSMAVTQLKQLFSEAGKSGTKLSDAIKDKLGASFVELTSSGKTSAAIFERLRQTMPAQEFRDLFSSVEASQAAMQLVGPNAKKVEAALHSMAGAGGLTKEAFDSVRASASQKFLDSMNTFKVTMMEIGVDVLPDLSEAMTKLSENLPTIMENMKAWFRGFKTAMTGIWTVLKPIFGLLNKAFEIYMAMLEKIFQVTNLLGLTNVDLSRMPKTVREYGAMLVAGAGGGATYGPMPGGAVGGGVAYGPMPSPAYGPQQQNPANRWLAGGGAWVDELGIAVANITETMFPFQAGLTALSEASRIANESFGMTAEKTEALAAIENVATLALQELTNALLLGKMSFEEVEEAWAQQIKDGAAAIEGIRTDAENKVVEAIERARREQAEEAARQLAISKVQIGMMGKSIEEIVASGQLVGMTRSQLNTLFKASQMNTIANQQARSGIRTFMTDQQLDTSFGKKHWTEDISNLDEFGVELETNVGRKMKKDMQDALTKAYLEQGMVAIKGGNLGMGGRGVADLMKRGAIARTGVHEISPGVYYNVTIQGNIYASDDSGRSIVEDITTYAASQGQTAAETLGAAPAS